MEKKYVEVIARFDLEGKITPLTIIWPDGRTFEIDRVLDVRRAASIKAGGLGIRYTIRILGKETYIWYDEPRWFVEEKV